MDYDYPGNVRELLNVLERAVVFKLEDFSELMVEHQQMNAGLHQQGGSRTEDHAQYAPQVPVKGDVFLLL